MNSHDPPASMQWRHCRRLWQYRVSTGHLSLDPRSLRELVSHTSRAGAETRLFFRFWQFICPQIISIMLSWWWDRRSLFFKFAGNCRPLAFSQSQSLASKVSIKLLFLFIDIIIMFARVFWLVDIAGWLWSAVCHGKLVNASAETDSLTSLTAGAEELFLEFTRIILSPQEFSQTEPDQRSQPKLEENSAFCLENLHLF